LFTPAAPAHLPNVRAHGIFARIMNHRTGVVVLALLSLGLAIALIVIGLNAASHSRKASGTILTYSNELAASTLTVETQKLKLATLETNLSLQEQAFAKLTNSYSRMSADLSQVSANLAKAEASLKNTELEMAKRNETIMQLTAQNQELDKQALDLSSAITNLTAQITDAQRRLTSSEGDRAFLEKELQRLMAEKAELERQFNDLAIVRAQVAKLKSELNISRRIEWIRQGLYANSDQRGAQQLMQGLPVAQPPAQKTKPTYDLNVEVGADGTVKIIPPLNSRPTATNAPAAK
jgi:septal ring factor EnvC (AmiA/AmiB activator)